MMNRGLKSTKLSSKKSLLALAVAAGAASLFGTSASRAATITWNGAANGTWDTTATNWSGASGTPWDSTNGPTNIADFNTASLAATVSGIIYTNGIIFDAAGSLTGGTITLAGTAPTITTNATGSISSILAGTAGLTKTGSGTLVLTGANIYTGGTTINAGTLQIGSGGTTGSIDSSNTVTFGTGNTNTLAFNRSDNPTFSNNIFMTAASGENGNISVAAGQTVTLTGSITGNGGEFWTTGLGTVVITPNTGSNTRSSSNVIKSGTLSISDFSTSTLGSGNFYIAQGGSGTLLYTGATTSTARFDAFALQGTGSNATINVSNAATTLTITSAIGSGGGNGLTVAGAGTLLLSGANTYTGATLVNSGTLQLNGSAFTTTPRSYTVASGAVLALGGGGTLVEPTGTTTVSGAGTFRILNGTTVNNASSGTGHNLTISMAANGLIDVQSGASLVNGGWQNITWSSNLGNLNVDGTFDIWDGNNVTVDALTGAGAITKGFNSGSNVLIVGANNGSGTFSGQFLNPQTTHYSVQKNGTGSETFSGNNTAATTYTVNGGTLTLSGTVDNNGGSANVNSGGLLILGKTSTSGVHAIGVLLTINSGGTAQLAGTGGDQIYSGASVTINGGGVFDLNGQSEGFTTLLLNGTGISNGGALINNTNTGVTLTPTGTTMQSNSSVGGSGNIILANAITGTTFSLTKIGAGTLSLQGADSYSGGTTISAGALSLGTWTTGAASGGSSTGLGTGPVWVASGAQLVLATTALNIANNITLNGPATNGAIIGAIATGAQANTISGTLTLASTSNITTFYSDKVLTISGLVTGGGGLTIDPYTGGNNPGGIIILSNPSNNYQGNTTVDPLVGTGTAPVLRAGAANVIPSGASAGTVTVNGVFDLNTYSQAINGLAGSGTVDTVAGGSPTLTLGNNNATNTFSGVIKNSAGNLSLIKTGTGTQTLTGANTYTGGTTVSAGTLTFSPTSAAAWNLSGSKTVASGAVLNLNLTGQVDATQNTIGAFALNGTWNVSSTTTGNDGSVLAGMTLTGNGTLNINNSGSAEVEFGTWTGTNNDLTGFSGIINVASGVAGLNSQLTGSLGANTSGSANLDFRVQTGATFILREGSWVANLLSGGGTISDNSSATGTSTLLIGRGNGTSTFTGLIQNGTGLIALTKEGTGTLTLAGTSTYTGGTTISGGVLQIGNAGTTGSLGTGAVTDNAVLAVNRSDTGNGFAIGNVISGSGSLTVMGTGVISLTASNSYSGGTTVSSGVLAVGQNTGGVNGDGATGGTATSLGSGPVTVAAGASLQINPTGFTIANNITLNGLAYGANSGGPAATNNGVWNGALVGGTFGTTTTNFTGTITLNATSNVSTNWTDKTLLFSGQVTGAGGLVIDNSAPSNRRGSTVQLSNALNNYQGDTTINAGNTLGYQPTLVTLAANVIPGGASAGNVNVNGNLNLNGFNQSINGLAGSGTLDGVSGTPTLTLGNRNATNNFSGTLKNSNGALAIIKTGSGTETLSGSNITYSGGTTVNGGTLAYTSSVDGTIYSTSDITSNANVSFAGTGNAAVVFNSNLHGAGTFTIDGPGGGTIYQNRVILRGTASDNTGTINVINSGKLWIDRNTNAIGDNAIVNVGPSAGFYVYQGILDTFGGLTGSGNVYGGDLNTSTLSVGNVTAAFSGVIQNGTGGNVLGLTKVGVGTQTLSGSNSYTGATTISAGKLLLANTGSLANTAVAVNATGALSGTGTVNGLVTVNNGGAVNLIDGSAGSLTLNAGLTTNAGSTLYIEVGSAADFLKITGALTVSGNTVLNVTPLTGFTAGTYTLASFTSMTGSLTLGTLVAGGYNLVLSSDANHEYLTTTVANNAYWNSVSGTTWSAASWTQAIDGTGGAVTPGGREVIFTTNGTGSGAISAPLGTSFDIHSLAFNSNATGGVTIDCGANTLTIEGGGITIDATSGAHTIQSSGGGGVVVGASQIWSNNGSNLFTVSAGITGTATTGNTTQLTLNGAGTGGMLIGGVIGNGGAGGKLAVLVNSGGTVVFTGTNTYTGGTTISTGTLQIGNGTTDGSIVTSSSITDSSALVYNLVGNQTYTAAISGGGTLAKSGGGTLTLNNASYTGGTTVSAGRLKFADNHSGSSNFTDNATLEFSQSTSGTRAQLNGGTISGTGNLIKSGPGVLLIGAQNSVENITLGAGSIVDVQGGLLRNEYLTSNWTGNLASLQIESGATFATWDSNTIVDALNGSGTVDKGINGTQTITVGINNGSGNFSGIIQNTLLDGQTTQTPILGFIKTGTGTQVLSGNNTYSGTTTISNGILQIGNGGSSGTLGAGAVTDNATLTFNRTDAVSVPNAITGSGKVINSGTGTTTLTGTQSTVTLDTNLRFTGGATVNAGTLQIVDANGLFNSTAGTGAQNINIAGGAVLELDSTINYAPKTAPYQTSSVSNWVLGTPGTVTVSGSGTLRFNGTGTGVFGLGDQGGSGGFVNFAMTGGTIDIEGGKLVNGGWQGGIWTNNKASMNIATNGTFDIWDGNSVLVDALTGNGTIDKNAGGTPSFTFGINNGSGAFSGVIKNTTGSIGLIKTGTGTETLSGPNTYTGSTTFNNGVLSVSAIADSGPSNFGPSGAMVFTGGTLLYTGGSTSTTRGASLSATSTINVQNAGAALTLVDAFNSTGSTISLIKQGAGILALSGAVDDNTLIVDAEAGQVNLDKSAANQRAVAGISNIATGATVMLTGNGGDQIYGGSNQAAFGVAMGGGTLDLNSRSESIDHLTGTGTVTNSAAASNATFTIGESGGSGAFNGVIQDGAGTMTLSKVGAGILTLGGANTFSGTTSVTAGTLKLTNTLALQNSTVATGGTGIVFDSTVATHAFTFGGLAGSGNLALQDNGTPSPVALSVGNNNGTTIYSGILSAGGSLTKIGTGSLTLSGSNTYGGGTNVNSGKLIVANTTGSATGTGTVTVASGGTLAGSQTTAQGFISGPVNVNGGGTLAAFEGASQATGSPLTLTINNTLTLNNASGAILNFNLTGTPTNNSNPLINVTNLTLNGSGLTTVQISGSPASGTYDLIGYSGSLTNFGGFNSAVTGPGPYAYALVSNSGQVDLVVATALTWTGNAGSGGTGTWDTTSVNWGAGATPLKYVDSGTLPVQFNDANSVSGGNVTNSTVTIQGSGVSPQSVLFNNSAVTYTLSNQSGNIGITGSTGLTKSGSGTAILGSINTYTGGTTVTAGILQVNVDHALGNNATATVAGGELKLSSVAYTTQALNIAGTGTDAALYGTGNSSFAGAITLTNDASIGAPSGSTLTLTGGVSPIGNSVTFKGGGTIIIGVSTSSPGISGSPNFINVNDPGTNLLLNTVYTYSTNVTTQITNNARVTLGTGGVFNNASSGLSIGAPGDTTSTFNLNGHNDGVALLTLASGSVVGPGTLTVSTTVGPNGSGNLIDSGVTIIGTVDDTFAAAAANSLTLNGTVTGADNMEFANDALSGTGKVGSVVMDAPNATLSSTGTLTINGTSPNAFTVNSTGNVISSGIIAITGGTHTANQSSSSDLTINGTLQGNDALQDSATLEGTGTVTGNVTLGSNNAVSSSGTLHIQGNLSVSGTVPMAVSNISGGTVAVAGNTSLLGNSSLNVSAGAVLASTVTVFNNATLSGAGTVGGAVTVNAGGHIAPHDAFTLAPGTLTLNSNLNLANGTSGTPGNLDMNLGASSDLLNVLGSLTLGTGYVTLNPTPGAGFGPGTYELIKYGSDTGSLAHWASSDPNYRYIFTDNTLQKEIDVTVASVNDTSQILIVSPDSNDGMGATTKTIAFGNVLLNGVKSVSESLHNTSGVDAAGYTITLGGANGIGYTSMPLNGSIVANGTLTGNIGVRATSPGAVSGTITIHNTASTSGGTGQGSADGDDVFTVTATSGGNATAALSDRDGGAPSAFQLSHELTKANAALFVAGNALTADVSDGGSYASLASMTSALQGNGVAGTTATILAGTNTSGSTRTVSMNWRNRSTLETQFPAANPPFHLPYQTLISDVVLVTGMNNGAGVDNSGLIHQTDMYALQMSYDPSLLPGGATAEAQVAASQTLFLAWLDPTDNYWKNAVLGNFGGTPNFVGLHTFSNTYFVLGDWGVDTVNHDVWAVLDHNSQFAVEVPEPTSLGLLGLGALGLLGRRRKNRA
jgi:fibronectin-binding autotransporter adhesin